MFAKVLISTICLTALQTPALPALERVEQPAAAPSYEKMVSRANKTAKEGDLAAAEQLLDQAIIATPERPRAYHLRGNVRFAAERYSDALQDFDRVIEISPNSANAHTNKAVVLLAMGDFERAMESINKALDLKNDSAFAMYVKDAIELERESLKKGKSQKAK